MASTRAKAPATWARKSIDDLVIDDERSFRHVALYDDLKAVLRRAQYGFRVMPASDSTRWDRALFLNLTYWGTEGGGDVLESDHLAADVVAHVAWHHLAARAFASPPSADALFFGEAIASAFDVYLVGRLLGHAPDSSFLETQVPAMADAADAAGLSEAGFESLLESIAGDPDGAFEDLRALLVDATRALAMCSGPRAAEDALAALSSFDGHRFAPLLHRYELSNWLLYARAHTLHARAPGLTDPPDPPDPEVLVVDRALRAARGQGGSALEWLASRWIAPVLG
jgi:hypothetical protein